MATEQRSSEAFGTVKQSIQHNIPKDLNLQQHHCQNLEYWKEHMTLNKVEVTMVFLNHNVYVRFEAFIS